MDKSLSFEDVRDLLELLQKHEVTEFKFERGEERLFLRRGSQAAAAPTAPQIQQVFGSLGPVPSQAARAEDAQPAKNAPCAPPVQPGLAVPLEGNQPAAAPAPKKKANAEVVSPMVGTFYRRPAVDAEPYVAVGDYVKKGDVLCIVEAMKLMNEIESDYAGKIVEVCLEDGQMVEYGEPLFRIETA